jgi:hypothetical protein
MKTMKKIFAVMMIIAILCGLCACGATTTPPWAEDEPNSEVQIGYALIPHHDGDECVDIWNWFIDDGVICVETMDGRLLASTNIVIIEE